MKEIFSIFKAVRKAGHLRPSLRTVNVNYKLNSDGTAIYMKDIDGNYIGKITATDIIVYAPHRHLLESITNTADNPQLAAIKYGRLTGNCSICGRHLDNKQSVDMGIGPICAEKFPGFVNLVTESNLTDAF